MSEWVDLTLDLHPDTPMLPFLPCPTQERVTQRGEETLQVTEVSLATHTGTHFDAACHAIEGGRSIESYPLDRWVTSGVVHEVDAGPGEEIGVDQVRELKNRLAPGDALILRTGWEDRVEDESYLDHPVFDMSLAEWLVAQEVNWIGMDIITPDKPPEMATGTPLPVHKTLLGNDVLIAENLTNLRGLVGERVDLVALPLRFRGLDGAPARIIARGGAVR